MVQESLEDAVLAKESSQPQSLYKAAATLIEFDLKKILINKMDKSESYLAALEHRECYKGLIKSYDLDKTIFFTYGKVYSLKRSQKDKDKDEDPFAGSDRGLKKRKTSKDAELTKEEPEFEVADLDMPQYQEVNPGKDDEEPKEKVASKHNWFTKPTKPQELTDPDWNVDKTLQQGQNQSWLMTLASSAEKPSKTFDELMITPIDFSVFIMNDLKINNLIQETLLGPAFRLLKGTRSNYAELEYDFEECYKALSEKLDWENSEGDDYPFDLTKPLPFVMNGNHQMVPVDYLFNNDLKYLQGGISTMTYTTSLTKTKAVQYDLLGIEDMIVVRQADNDLYRFKEGAFPRLCINDIEDMLLLVVQNRLKNISGNDVFDFAIALRMFTRSLIIQKNKLMRLDELYKFSDRTLTGLRTSLDDITKNIRMEYLPKRRSITLEKKRANIMIKAIDKQLKERRLMRSLKKFVCGRHYGTDLRLLQRTI
ncbi:hypothetical protein Tco_0748471 [Tanacetum coccineum]|uniref:Reverse transcriptase domain-containing protein n=1 Tax=Tanacetum coccineum TaxID=301880 RepID=A0ABQ4YVY8_9ASTR